MKLRGASSKCQFEREYFLPSSCFLSSHSMKNPWHFLKDVCLTPIWIPLLYIICFFWHLKLETKLFLTKIWKAEQRRILASFALLCFVYVFLAIDAFEELHPVSGAQLTMFVGVGTRNSPQTGNSPYIGRIRSHCPFPVCWMSLPCLWLVKPQVLFKALAVHAVTTHSSEIDNKSLTVAQLSAKLTEIEYL